MKISAVFVMYNPALEDFKSNVESMYPQVDHIYVIDNSEACNPISFTDPKQKIFYKWMEGNHGIGKAQNVGLHAAIENGSDFVILSDQDTSYPSDYASSMLAAFSAIPEQEQVAALTPRFYDLHRKMIVPIVQRKNIFRKKIYQTSEIEPVSEAIASGLFIKTSALKSIGFINEHMFIGLVDFEWCWRAIGSRHHIFSVKSITINHAVGSKSFSFGGKKYSVHPPIRYYYVVRNSLFLGLYCQYLPINLRINILLNSIKYVVGFIFIGKPKVLTIKYIAKAIIHGLINRTGKLQK